MGAGTFLWDPDSQTIDWSDGFARLHGFSARHQPVTFQDLVNSVPETEQNDLRVEVLAARDTQATLKATYPVMWPDGTEHWVHAQGAWVPSADGSAAYLFGIALDADERVQFEQQLAESERRLRDAQAAGGVGVWDFDIVTQSAHVSDEYLRIHGFDDANYSLKHYRKYVPAEDLVLQREALERASVPGSPYEVEHRIVHAKTGEIRWVHGRGTGQFDHTGKLVRLLGTTQDVTERKRAEAALLDSTRIFQTLTEASPTLVFRADARGRITFVNEERWQQFSGRNAGDWRGSGWLEALHREDRERARTEARSALATRAPLQGEYRWQHVNGEVRSLLFHARPVHSDEGFTGFVGTAMDVTALKASEQERTRLQLALADSQKLEAIGTLASGVAHDFNNVLAGVRGFVELAALETDATSVAAGYLAQAQAAIDQARDVTSGLLTFARRERSDKQVVSLDRVIVDNLGFLRKLVPAAIAIETNIGDHGLTVSADASQLRQVLVNLIINARDAMPRGGCLQVVLERDDAHALLRVCDDGQGMDDATLKRVFEPFFTTKPHGQGTGLGLSIVHGIVTAHDGQVEIDSDAGRGTCVSVRLPLSEAEPPGRQNEAGADAVGSGQLVLIVEDNRLVREACVLRLRAGGFDAVAAEHSEAALDLFDAAEAGQRRIDAAVLDVDLPGRNGVAVAKALRQRRSTLPVVFITGNAQNLALGDIGNEPVLTKPLDFQALFAALNGLLPASRAAR